LYNLPLHPFDAYNYGKQYLILPLVRQHEPYILAHFPEYITTHLKPLMLKSPDGAVDLVKRYVNNADVAPIDPSIPPPTNKFKEWLGAKSPAPQNPQSSLSELTPCTYPL
jgi:hypothetical protein